MWTGGYNVPPLTITDSIRSNIMFIEEIIGVGEIAIADGRSTDPTAHEMERLTNDAYVAGKTSKKAGISHFHIGEGATSGSSCCSNYWTPIKRPPETIYATHIERSDKLMAEAADLSRRGCYVDTDTVEEDLAKQLKLFIDKGGAMEKLAVSSDSSLTPPVTIFAQIRGCILNCEFSLEKILPLPTANVAEARRRG